MSKDSETISVVILSWNTSELTRKCLESLRNHGGKYNLEIIVVDNASSDSSAEDIEREFNDIKLIKNSENLLYAKANNQGVKHAKGEWLCLLNSDTEVSPGSLDILVDYLKSHPSYIISSPQLISFNGDVQKGCNRIPPVFLPFLDVTALKYLPISTKVVDEIMMKDFSHDKECDVDQPPGTCLVMKTIDFVELGGFDEELSLFFNDVDLSRRAWETGRKTRFIPDSKIYHHEGASTAKYERISMGNPLFFINRCRYYHKWDGIYGFAIFRVALFFFLVELLIRALLGRKSIKAKRKALAELLKEYFYITKNSRYLKE